MEHPGWHPSCFKLRGWKRSGISVLLGVPLIAGLLWVTQSDWRSRLKLALHRQFSSLQQDYQYPYFDSLPANPNLTGAIQREIAFYQQSVRQHPDQGLNQAALAVSYLRMARATGEDSWYLLAEQAAQQSLQKLPQNHDAIAVLARVAEARHDFVGALQWAAKISGSRDALGIQTTVYLAMGNLPAADRAATALVEQTLSMNAFSLQAMVNVAQGKEDKAFKHFKYALEVEEAGEISTSARVRTLLGRLYYQRGQLQQSRELYQEALAILPDYPQALLNQAQLAIRQGDYPRAWGYYQQAAPEIGAPTVFEPLILRGRARIQLLQGNRAGAETLWGQAEMRLRQGSTGTSGNTFGHRRDLASVLLERGNPSDISEAVALMQTETQVRRDADTLEIYAWALERAQRLTEAQALIQSAIAQGTRNPTVFVRAIAIARAMGDSAAASRYRQRIQEIDSTYDERAQQAARLGAGLGT